MKVIRKNNNVIVDMLGQEKLIIYIDAVSGAPTAHLSRSDVKGWEDEVRVLASGERIANGYVLDFNGEKRPVSRPSQKFARW